MMSCAELITMCLLSAKHSQEGRNHSVAQQISSQDLSIFRDIFRRADKNDDGKLSFEEFKHFFSDGVLKVEELREMYSRIDCQHSNNMDTERLCDYFSKHLGEYGNVLMALDNLNVTILAAMDKTKMDYDHSSQTEQFVTRFLLRETMNQLHSLQSSLECALETIEIQSGCERQDVKKTEPQRVGRRCHRKSQKSACPTDRYSGILTTGLPVESDSQWSAQISRLQQLIDKLEYTRPQLEPLMEDLTCKGRERHILVAQRRMTVTDNHLEQFKMSLKTYIESATNQSHCLHISVQRLHPEPDYMIYEFWENQDSWQRHLQSTQSKTFQRAIIDCLEEPELTRTMLFPASWWILNCN
ncbi:N-terminal EF-hand calcium-binding protein 3 [Bombina bombina]|uniref:N-terminal EF-hand calcium-binding protein 3 n=1 Tax=Bombina bombina TaxID=8345 RepID=UPI00235B1683|nr:N-terminal EF-hand calcium-binding protein 3 [Bombina bombina]